MGTADESELPWRVKLEKDIELLRSKGLRPPVVLVKLEQVLDGADDGLQWREFSACGRGKSNSTVDLNIRTITIEFRDAGYAYAVYELIYQERNRLQIIERVAYRELTNCAIITIVFPEPDRNSA